MAEAGNPELFELEQQRARLRNSMSSGCSVRVVHVRAVPCSRARPPPAPRHASARRRTTCRSARQVQSPTRVRLPSAAQRCRVALRRRGGEGAGRARDRRGDVVQPCGCRLVNSLWARKTRGRLHRIGCPCAIMRVTPMGPHRMLPTRLLAVGAGALLLALAAATAAHRMVGASPVAALDSAAAALSATVASPTRHRRPSRLRASRARLRPRRRDDANPQPRGRSGGATSWASATSAARPPTTPANIKSASKSVISALVGIALQRGRPARARPDRSPSCCPADTRGLDTAKRAITVEDLLTMRAGLQSTSFGNYGAWVSSRNWVRDALAPPDGGASRDTWAAR